MILSINGVTFARDDLTHKTEDKKSTGMLGTGDGTATATLDKALLETAGITDVSAVQLKIALGHDAYGSAYEDVTFTADLYPGAKVDVSDWFPEPKDSSLVLYDGEEGKVQITDIQLWKSNKDDSLLGVKFYVLAKGKSDETSGLSVNLDELEVDGWVADDTMGRNYIWVEGSSLYQCTIHDLKEDCPVDADLSKAVLHFTIMDHSTDGEQEKTIPLDLTAFAD